MNVNQKQHVYPFSGMGSHIGKLRKVTQGGVNESAVGRQREVGGVVGGWWVCGHGGLSIWGWEVGGVKIAL